MIFSSNAFIFAFLPIALIGYYALGRLGRSWAATWLVAMSLVFYGYWNPSYLLLLIASIVWNYSLGAVIFRAPEARPRRKFWLLFIGIGGNLALLAYYKYLFPAIGFLAAHHLAPSWWEMHVILPLGISFFTFTQIGYLIDSYDGAAKERGPLSYALFVTFFPHLIAGPILHNREMMPQFVNRETFRLRSENISVGLSIFAIGMAKKVLLADPLGFVADTGFASASQLGAGAAWYTILAYSMQLYFDFSGYSDMAIGIARLFGVVFPANFNSPYRSASIIDFWSRWHMTLTRYLTLFLYNPVAVRVSRRRMARGLGVSRRATRNLPAFAAMIAWPTFLTMGLAGVWHGAGFQFLIFGLLHASYLSINHAWRVFGPDHFKPGRLAIGAMMLLTYLAVLLGQIFFRSASVPDAVAMLVAAFDPGRGLPADAVGAHAAMTVRIAFCMALCLFAPNTQQIMRGWRPVLEPVTEPPLLKRLSWTPSWRWGFALGLLTVVALLRMSDTSKFLYFQF